MANFSATWANATNPTNFASARALNKMELNSSYYLLAKSNPQNLTESDGRLASLLAEYTSPTGARAANTTYTYTGTCPRMLIVSVNLTSTADTLNAGGIPTCSLQIKDDTDGALVQIQNGQVNASPAIVGGARTEYVWMYAIVNPNIGGGGAQYRVNTTAPTRSTATILNWLEFDLSASHVPVTYTHGQTITNVSTLNRYANGVNAQAGTSTITSAAFQLLTTEITNGDFLSFFAPRYSNPSGISIDSNNSAGSINHQIGQLTVTPNGTRCLFFPCPPLGKVRSSGAASVSPDSNRILISVNASPITFTANESGTSTGDKFRTLDSRNLNGCNITKKMVRTSRGSGTANKSTSATSWSFFSVPITIPDATGTSSITVFSNIAPVVTQTTTISGGSVTTPTTGVTTNMASMCNAGATLTYSINNAGGAPSAGTLYTWHFPQDT